jgi:predicted enzyme related to lactoylglutathione lyase
MSNAIDWFEIFVTDMDRAVRFYERTLGIALRREIFANKPTAVFPGVGSGVAGALVQDSRQAPGGGGTLVYLNATGKLEACLDRAPAAGGAVVLARTDIGDPGFIATIRDSEGNLVGLHSER